APEPAPPADPSKPPEPEKKDAPPGDYVAQSVQPINVVVVADCDMLGDRFWVQTQQIFGRNFSTPFADNGDFVIGALDNLSGSSDLISIRARGRYARPFDRVKAIQKDADQKFLAKQNDLQKKLTDTENKISELQRQRPDAQGGQSGMVLLTPEQQKEIDNFRKEQVETRKQLREVRHQMGKDIDRLGMELKFINIGLVPLLVGAGAVGLGLWRASRRRHDRWTPRSLN
ncbi:MAG TPA: hypothetical protein VMM80_01970, partial [Bacteroidota bacterium]|nr:hypothetical protein [Bacteroidota bacterium]